MVRIELEGSAIASTIGGRKGDGNGSSVGGQGRGQQERVLSRVRVVAAAAPEIDVSELDDISGNGQTQAAHGLTKGIAAKNKQHFEAKGVGHYGIFSGRKYREMIYPRVRDFIAKHG